MVVHACNKYTLLYIPFKLIFAYNENYRWRDFTNLNTLHDLMNLINFNIRAFFLPLKSNTLPKTITHLFLSKMNRTIRFFVHACNKYTLLYIPFKLIFAYNENYRWRDFTNLNTLHDLMNLINFNIRAFFLPLKSNTLPKTITHLFLSKMNRTIRFFKSDVFVIKLKAGSNWQHNSSQTYK